MTTQPKNSLVVSDEEFDEIIALEESMGVPVTVISVNELVLARVDEALKGCTRNLIPIEEFTDTLLDIRSIVAPAAS